VNHSDNIGALAAALAKAQGQMGPAIKDASNPFFKSQYADLASVVAAIKTPLSTNGLAYVQATDIDETGTVIVETMLMHASGEWIGSRLPIRPAKADAQGVGSALSYARRYGLQALVGVPSDDDDGNAAVGKEIRDVRSLPAPTTPVPTGHAPVGGWPPQNRGDMPANADALELRAWFVALAETINLEWTEEQKLDYAKSLAIDLKKAGLREVDRPLAYRWLTGVSTGTQMTAVQIALLAASADKVDALTLCAMAQRAVDKEAAAASAG
jgi:hypothetical protein